MAVCPGTRYRLDRRHPGSGKTILAQQYVFHNASTDRPAVYLTTVSEPLEKVLRYGQSLDFSITLHSAQA